MSFTKENAFIIIGAVVVTLLQLVVAPYVKVFNAMPNFMAAYAIVVAVVRPRSTRTVILSFAMGLLYNLFVGGVVGSLSVVLILVATGASLSMRTLANDTHFQPLAIMAVSMVVVELAYLVVLLASGLGLGFGQALLFRALPCAVYDVVVGAILYMAMSRLATSNERLQPNHGPTLLR
ncbi:MAG: rod shape-determining protein MreD [Coriobacteriia bacterium]|nr:rod shape-determining protein MreD [Coriobacteriia bacterium]